MNLKRAVMMAVLVVAVAALALPLMRTKAAAGKATMPALPTATSPAAVTAAPPLAQETRDERGTGRIDPAVAAALGERQGRQKAARGSSSSQATVDTQSGQPLVLNASSALSAALMTTIGGRDNQFSEATLLADWDGREDCVADREQKVDDFSFAELEIDFLLTKVGVSEHTFANGFRENVYYYGDSIGNLWVGTDLNPSIAQGAAVDSLLQINIPALVQTGTSNGVPLLNRATGDCVDDQVTVTGIAVNPVADLGDFGLCGTVGEVVYVSTWDSEGCADNAANQVYRTRIFAFAFTDGIGANAMTPRGVRQILRTPLSNIAGLSVDDDGSLYFQLVDLIQNTGAAIFKATEVAGSNATTPDTIACPGPRVNRVIRAIPGGAVPINNSLAPSSSLIGGTIALSLSQASQLTANNNSVVEAGERVRLTNYSGTSTTFGNIVSIASGPCNVLYAAVSASFVSGGVSFEQLTQGLFPAPSAFATGLPSMVITFADCAGGFDACTSPATGVAGNLPVADGRADAASGTGLGTAGVNNFRVFVLGNGPDIRGTAGGAAVVTTGTLKIDMQIDYTLHSGISVNEEGTVFVISGGTPAGIGKNPSPMLGEILCFEDMCPMDRRADYVDLRGDAVPNPPASGGNQGDRDSDRFDHIFYQAPLDQVTITPGGLSGLADGFLRYTNRLAPRPIAIDEDTGPTQRLLGTDAGTQADDSTAGPIIFEDFDPGHQVAGGDDQETPFRGDDNNGFGSDNGALGAFSGGFEFVFLSPPFGTGENANVAPCVWNSFWLNSNGNITFGSGDKDNTPTVLELRTDQPRLAVAWADLNPAARGSNPRAFPVQAMGFANVNAFRVRWIDVPEFGSENCSTSEIGIIANTFGVTLYDDGTGAVVAPTTTPAFAGQPRSSDENNSRPYLATNPTGNNAASFDWAEGPTDLRFTVEPVTATLVGCPPRRNGTGHFIYDYCKMNLLGTADRPVIVGYSIGNLSPLNPPGLCEINLSEAAKSADQNVFGVIQSATASIQACLIGEGTEPTIFELFNEGKDEGVGSGGEVTLATPDFDLRFDGNDPAACSTIRQRDNNRGKVGFFGIGCTGPVNPECQQVVLPSFATAPGTGGDLIDAICSVQVSLIGCGFFPNETTTICQNFATETGQPLQRPGKTVTTSVALVCDTNGDGVVDATINLGAVTPVNINLLRATLQTINEPQGLRLTAFPLACCGGPAVINVATTFSSGDNNAFGSFTRTTSCAINLGLRAPVVISITPGEADCANSQTVEDLLISGACFSFRDANGTLQQVTSVFAVEQGNPNNVIQATRFQVLSNVLLNADFQFGTANAGKTFLIFVCGPGGCSQNLTTAPSNPAAAGCPTGTTILGNQAAIQVTFKCEPPQTGGGGPGGGGGTPDLAVVNMCEIVRTDAGAFLLVVSGSNIKTNATVTVSGQSVNKVKFKQQQPNGTFNQLILKGGVCNKVPGPIVITNPTVGTVPGGPSASFQCNRSCPTN